MCLRRQLNFLSGNSSFREYHPSECSKKTARVEFSSEAIHSEVVDATIHPALFCDVYIWFRVLREEP